VDIRRRDFPTVPSLRWFSEALKIAHMHDRGGYDCMWCCFGRPVQDRVDPADERLANALAARLPSKGGVRSDRLLSDAPVC
jgi:hypothetical protein